jgi:hypothetical protein
MHRGGDFDRTTRHAVGCFTMLILGAIILLGVVLVVPAELLLPPGEGRRGWRQSVLLWVVMPAIGMSLVAWLTYRTGAWRRPTGRKRS